MVGAFLLLSQAVAHVFSYLAWCHTVQSAGEHPLIVVVGSIVHTIAIVLYRVVIFCTYVIVLEVNTIILCIVPRRPKRTEQAKSNKPKQERHPFGLMRNVGPFSPLLARP